MENKNGNGIFLGVVAVATLVVAIIGATFAYFSASTESNEGAVGAEAYEFDVAVTSVEKIEPTKGDAIKGLIPLDADGIVTGGTTSNILYALNDATNKCVDDKNFQVCHLYKATITNGGEQAVSLSLEVKTNTNTASSADGRTPFEDLTFQSLTASGEETITYALDGLAKTLPEESGDSTTIDGVTINAASGTTEHYFVVYLDEPTVEGTGAKDQSAQMGASYTGQLVYTTAGGSNRLSGSFTVAGGE